MQSHRLRWPGRDLRPDPSRCLRPCGCESSKKSGTLRRKTGPRSNGVAAPSEPAQSRKLNNEPGTRGDAEQLRE